MQRTKDFLIPDSKGRISLGKHSAEIIGYKKVLQADGRILLEPMAGIPLSELWLYKDKEALKKVERGLKQSKAGDLHTLGSFANFAKEEK